ncbi:MAG: hypothetical protein ACJ798_16565 [Phenylobacterium sp.]
MRFQILATAAVALAAAAALAACDKSPQTADGTTKAGDPGTAATTPNGTIASTGSPEQGGANGTPATPTPTINQIDRATPASQASGKANADTEAQRTAAGGARR